MKAQDSPEKFLAVARDLAQGAAEIVLKFQNSPEIISRKADRSEVTDADLQSDEWIRNGLQKAFPDHGILTEEGGLVSNRDSEFIWMVDPLDGTKAFTRGMAGYCVMVGLLRGGSPYLGVVVDPRDGHSYEAIRGEGAFHFLGGKKDRLKVSSRKSFSEMPLVVSTGFPEKKLKEILQRLGSPVVEPINSVGIKVGLLVRQVGDIYLNHHGVHYWDTCAPQIILEEAGGVFTKLDGSSLEYSLDGKYSHEGPTLASNGTRHGELVKMLMDLWHK